MLLLLFSKFLFDETGQVWMIALLFVADKLINFVLPLFMGRALDGLGSKVLLVAVAALSGLISLCAALSSLVVEFVLGLYLVASIVLSALDYVSRMAVFAVTPALVAEDALPQTNARLGFSYQVGQLVGMAMAAGSLSLMTPAETLVLAAGMYFSAMLFYQKALATVEADGNSRAPVRTRRTGYLRAVAKAARPHVPAILASNFGLVGVNVFNILLVTIVDARHSGDTVWLAALDGAFAVGALVAGMLLARWRRSETAGLNATVYAQAAFIVCLGLWMVPGVEVLALVGLATFGYLQTHQTVYWKSRLQASFSEALFGGLTSVRFLASSVQIGLVGGVVASAHMISFEAALIVSALAVLLQIGLFYWFQRLKTI